MTKRLEKIRDELAGIFMIDPTVDGGVSVECFKAGFNAAARELWPKVEGLVAALEHITAIYNNDEDCYPSRMNDYAEQSLASFRKATGDE